MADPVSPSPLPVAPGTENGVVIQTADAAPASSAGMEPVLLKGEIEIYPDQRLPHLDQGMAKAYAASGRAKEKAFALICERALVPQINSASKFATLNTPLLPRLIGAGVVDWTPAKQQRYVFVYENRLGLPLANPSNFTAMGIKADSVLHGFVKKFVPLLKQLRDLEFVHGNIQATNVYTGGGNGFERVMLGECLSNPPAYQYPIIYETIERAMAKPIARGVPSYADDLYAFGVLLAVMIRHSDPLAGWEDEDIIAYKVEHGSFQALTGRERVTGSILELLRGLLTDDLQQRWTIEDIIVWLDGQRVSPKQASPLKPKAARPIEFMGEKYLRPQTLALNLYKNPIGLSKMNEGGELKLWINRSIQDKALEENVEHAANAAKELGTSGEAYAERMASYIGVALSPGTAISYRTLRFNPMAFGRMLAEAFATNKDLQYFAEFIQTSIVSFWGNLYGVMNSDTSELLGKFEACRSFLRQSGQGYGLERCLYFMCPEAPCMSEKIKEYYVRTPEELMMAYERMAGSTNRPEGFFDRHIVAFLSVKDRAVIDPYIPDLNSSEAHRNVLGAIRILSFIQRRGKMPLLPGVTSWIADKMDPVLNRFHDRETRVKLKAQLAKLRDKGDIAKLEQVFDDMRAIEADYNGYKHAMFSYVGLKNEYSALEHDLAHNPKFGFKAGHQAAVLTSGLVATIVVLATLFLKLSAHHPGF